MMGGHHAISGTAAWMALTGSVEVLDRHVGLGLWSLDGAQVLSGALVATGAALLPDIDHPGATVSRSAGRLSKLLTRSVGAVAGHRGATHTLLAVLAVTALAVLVSGLDHRARVPVLGEIPTGPVVLVGVMCALGTRALKVVEGVLLPWLVGLASALLIAVIAPEVSIWLPAAVAVGTLTHLVGDLLTTDGIPFPTWPLVVRPPRSLASALWQRSGDIALPLLGNAGSAREWLVCTALTAYASVAIVVTLTGTPGLLTG
ncbi:metal-dependent hydrolase [Brachybacterium sacelli]|uniref:Membrane-bound metal-dependent hydrolase YbcI (DUF457 family) n=1 Tax=Brachybacterium sacelli TaxID=173364 RepID=A0ABS4X0J1_9MICO|nr:metal-dependent hydrolase [Brachybacterium sacelli]MBP2381743.1 membrane-bound metal-dependent hydrolase YbcI (DUF457 family) [Brachybacterium sacelli]